MHGLIDIHDPLRGLAEGIVALGLCMARWLGLTLIMPVFSRTGLTGLVRGGFSFAMSVSMLPMGIGTIAGLERSTALVALVALTFKEWTIGLAIGLLLGVPFWAAEMAGDFLDVQRGTAGGSGMSDPQGMNKASVIGSFFAIVSVALFLIAGGVDIIAAVVYDSYKLWPMSALAPSLREDSVEIFVGLLQKMMVIAVSIAAPLAIATIASDILLGFIGRLAPSLNSYQMGAALKSLILAAMMPLYAWFFLSDLAGTLVQLKNSIQDLGAFAK